MFGLNALLSLALVTDDLQLASAVDAELRAHDEVTRSVDYVTRSAQLCVMRGDVEEARRVLCRHIRLQPTCAEGWEQLARHSLTNRCYASAVRCCDVTAFHDAQKQLKVS